MKYEVEQVRREGLQILTDESQCRCYFFLLQSYVWRFGATLTGMNIIWKSMWVLLVLMFWVELEGWSLMWQSTDLTLSIYCSSDWVFCRNYVIGQSYLINCLLAWKSLRDIRGCCGRLVTDWRTQSPDVQPSLWLASKKDWRQQLWANTCVFG